MKALANALTKVSNLVDRVMLIGGLIFLTMMVVIICLQVVARYGFSAPPPWTEEAARYSMVWVGLLGAAVSFKAGFDPALVKIPHTLSPPLRVLAACIRGTAVVIFLAPILWYCFYGPNMNTARSFLARNLSTTAESFEMSMIFVAITVPIFIIAIFLHGAASIARNLAGIGKMAVDEPYQEEAEPQAN